MSSSQPVNKDSNRGGELAAKIMLTAFIGSLLLGGLAPMLMAVGILPVDPAKVHAPYWVLFVCGAIFFGAGLYVLQLALSKHEDKRWSHLASSLFQTAIAAVAAWVAFGSGSRQFTNKVQSAFQSHSGPISESTGRTLFGVACSIVGILAIRAWYKFFQSLAAKDQA